MIKLSTKGRYGTRLMLNLALQNRSLSRSRSINLLKASGEQAEVILWPDIPQKSLYARLSRFWKDPVPWWTA